MNAKPILLFILLVVLALLGFGAQVYLSRTLDDLLTKRVIPGIEAEYGLVASYDSSNLDLLKRRVDLNGIVLRNPDGFRNPTLLMIDHCMAVVELKSLIKRDPIIINLVDINGTTMTVERNKERRINIQGLSDVEVTPPQARQAASSPARQQPTAAEKPRRSTAKKQSVPLQFRRIEIDGTVLYDDRARSRDYLFDVELAANNIFTAPATDQPSTLVTLRGALAKEPAAFATDLNAFIEPLVDPRKPTFNVTGSIENIDPKLIEKMLEKNEMKCGAFSITPSIACKGGLLDGSTISATLKELAIHGSKVENTTLDIPIQGSLTEISINSIDLTGALQSLFSNNAGSLLNALIQKKVKPEKKKPDEKPKKEASVGDVLIDKLGGSVKEIDGNQKLKKSLRELGDSLFGD